MQGNRKSLANKDMRVSEKGDYKPAYKKSQKTPIDQLQEMPAELAEIVTVWHHLPAHITAAIMALVQTATQGGAR